MNVLSTCFNNLIQQKIVMLFFFCQFAVTKFRSALLHPSISMQITSNLHSYQFILRTSVLKSLNEYLCAVENTWTGRKRCEWASYSCVI